MCLEDYKKAVEDYLTKTFKASTEVTNELMREYEDDFQEFMEEGLKPNAAGLAMLLKFV